MQQPWFSSLGSLPLQQDWKWENLWWICSQLIYYEHVACLSLSCLESSHTSSSHCRRAKLLLLYKVISNSIFTNIEISQKPQLSIDRWIYFRCECFSWGMDSCLYQCWTVLGHLSSFSTHATSIHAMLFVTECLDCHLHLDVCLVHQFTYDFNVSFLFYATFTRVQTRPTFFTMCWRLFLRNYNGWWGWSFLTSDGLIVFYMLVFYFLIPATAIIFFYLSIIKKIDRRNTMIGLRSLERNEPWLLLVEKSIQTILLSLQIVL